jgi:hypothetical protein
MYVAGKMQTCSRIGASSMDSFTDIIIHITVYVSILDRIC